MIDGDRQAAEMLQMFLRMMELECSLIEPDSDAVPTIRRIDPDAVVLDLDLPHGEALEIARRIHTPVIFVTDRDPGASGYQRVIAKPRGNFEQLLRLLELILDVA